MKLSTSPSGTYAGAFSAIEVKTNGSALSGEKSFYTFCVELYETLYTNTTLYVKSVSNATQNAVSSYYSQTNPASGGTATSDPLSVQTEWLFTQFNVDKNFQSSILSTNAKANSFQVAIWYLEHELDSYKVQSWHGSSTNSGYGYLYTQDSYAQTLVAMANAAVKNGWKDVGDQVRVLNLYKDNKYTQYAQDQLYFVSAVPEPESLAMMLVGVVGVAGFVRYRKRKTA
ncbi:PEP-CTERM sorting domain-containing protein [Curvibacter sp. CHRR-16]|uniref:PEP-CTERM sorting domain-containing protein n=1 Tax=Curvibacter sp. CHRR-16 TaxID=2835872 RepID=UPI001BD937BB|nr:PEP-CTERM sorting domain-containing protein [Curvibacter sp. CHRR-16]